MRVLIILLAIGSTSLAAANDVVMSGWIGADVTLFNHDGIDADQRSSSASVAVQPKFEYEADGDTGFHRWHFEPFFRVDQKDKQRTHADIRELSWTYESDGEWVVYAGIGKVFWGVTESVHLVDIINQTDLVDNVDTEEKLGQPLINFTWDKAWGAVDVFLMSGFRERTFPGKAGRLRSALFVDTDEAVFEARNEQAHVDWALRYSHAFGVWDVGVAHFSGTSREPLLQPAINRQGEVFLIPVYVLIDQTSIDLQATIESLLLKFEGISRSGQGRRFFASVAGFEYSFHGVFESDTDVGILLEYLYDDRGNNATTPFEDDVFIGTRIAFNNIEDTNVLAGIIYDLSAHSKTLYFEANHDLDDHWKLSLQGQIYSDTGRDPILANFREDDNIRLDLKYYY